MRSLDVSAIMCTFSKTAAGGKRGREACSRSGTGTSVERMHIRKQENGGENMVSESILDWMEMNTPV